MADNSTNFDKIDFGGGINGIGGGGDNNINFFGANTKQKKRTGDKLVQNKKQKKQNKKHRRKKNKEKGEQPQQQQQQNQCMVDNMHNNSSDPFKSVRQISQIEQSVISKQYQFFTKKDKINVLFENDIYNNRKLVVTGDKQVVEEFIQYIFGTYNNKQQDKNSLGEPFLDQYNINSFFDDISRSRSRSRESVSSHEGMNNGQNGRGRVTVNVLARTKNILFGKKPQVDAFVAKYHDVKLLIHHKDKSKRFDLTLIGDNMDTLQVALTDLIELVQFYEPLNRSIDGARTSMMNNFGRELLLTHSSNKSNGNGTRKHGKRMKSKNQNYLRNNSFFNFNFNQDGYDGEPDKDSDSDGMSHPGVVSNVSAMRNKKRRKQRIEQEKEKEKENTKEQKIKVEDNDDGNKAPAAPLGMPRLEHFDWTNEINGGNINNEVIGNKNAFDDLSELGSMAKRMKPDGVPEMRSLEFMQELDNVVDIMNPIKQREQLGKHLVSGNTTNEDVDNAEDEGEAEAEDDDHVM